jgi:hypothetical protein
LKIASADPGRKGAAALITGGGGFRRTIELINLPFDDDGVLDYRSWRDILVRWEPNVFYVENCWPRSIRAPNSKDGMGFISSTKFSKSLGALEAVAACYVPHCHKVMPAVWKKSFGLIGSAKDDSRATFAALWPQHANLVKLKKHDGLAEAGLIGTYGAIRQGLVMMVQG